MTHQIKTKKQNTTTTTTRNQSGTKLALILGISNKSYVRIVCVIHSVPSLACRRFLLGFLIVHPFSSLSKNNYIYLVGLNHLIREFDAAIFIYMCYSFCRLWPICVCTFSHWYCLYKMNAECSVFGERLKSTGIK